MTYSPFTPTPISLACKLSTTIVAVKYGRLFEVK